MSHIELANLLLIPPKRLEWWFSNVKRRFQGINRDIWLLTPHVADVLVRVITRLRAPGWKMPADLGGWVGRGPEKGRVSGTEETSIK